MYFSWRMFVDDPHTLKFDFYRSVDGGPEMKLNKESIIQTSDFIDNTANLETNNRWILKIGDRIVGLLERKKGETQHSKKALQSSCAVLNQN